VVRNRVRACAPDEIWYEVPDKTIYSIAEDYRLDMERLER